MELILAESLGVVKEKRRDFSFDLEVEGGIKEEDEKTVSRVELSSSDMVLFEEVVPPVLSSFCDS